jgi:hypothetical protein
MNLVLRYCHPTKECVLDSKQGAYQRTGILWLNEHFNKKVTEKVRQNANVKGKPNLTKHSLCQWINEELLPHFSGDGAKVAA